MNTFSSPLSWLFILTLVSLVAACTSDSRNSTQAQTSATESDSSSVTRYKAQLTLTEEAITNPQSEGERIVREARTLMAMGSELLKEISLKQSDCRVVLDLVAQNAEQMTALSVKQIEEKYHQGKALPQAPELCFEAKEFVVHPATVIVLAREKGFDSETRGLMAGELGELAHHVDTVELLLTRP
jgi:hypothetical protein